MMKSKVDKIVKVFSKTVSELRAEAMRLENIGVRAQEDAARATLEKDAAFGEANRADALANKIEEFMNA